MTRKEGEEKKVKWSHLSPKNRISIRPRFNNRSQLLRTKRTSNNNTKKNAKMMETVL